MYEQVNEIRRKHIEARDLKDSAEFMSGFKKNDKILPVITLCICFGKDKWDAPKSLHDMFGKIDSRLKPYINDYKLNLISPDEIEDFSKFTTGLGQAMEFIKNSDNKKQLRDIINSKKEYKNVDEDTVDIINIFTNTRISKDIRTRGGRINVCTAIQGLIDDGKIEGENMLIKLLKRLTPGTKEYDKAINGTTADRKKLYKKYKIID